MGLGCALLTPVGLTPDEPEHIARADGLWLGQVLGRQPAGQPTAGVEMNLAIFAVAVSEFGPTLRGAALPADVRKAAEAIGWTKAKIFCPTQMVLYFPVFYLPGAWGLGLGQALGLTPLHTVFFGRCCMLLVFLALGTAALALARHGRAFLFAILTLPTSLTLGASYNQDGLIIASGALAAALLTRAGPAPLDTARLGAFAVLEVICCAKLPYAPLFLMCLLPLERKSFWIRSLLVGLAMLPPLLWLFYLLNGHFSPWPKAPYHPGRLWPGSRSIWLHDVELRYNFAVMRAHPLRVALLPFKSFGLDAGRLAHEALALIGWQNLRLWAWEFPAAAMALLAAFAGAAPRGGRGLWRPADHAMAGAILLLFCLTLYFFAYLSLDKAGVGYISGVLGRYFLPFLPFCMFVLPQRGEMRRGAMHRGVLGLPAALLALVNVVALPLALFYMFRMAGP